MEKNKLTIILIIIIYWVNFTTLAANTNLDFDKKMLKDIETMEKRHFKNKPEGKESNEYRLSRLEETLMGRVYDELSLEKRMKRLKIASQKKLLAGTSMPQSVRMSQTRIQNEEVEIVDKDDNLGIIDGLMKLYAPQVFERFKAKNENMLRFQR